jgi:hypothetical protein
MNPGLADDRLGDHRATDCRANAAADIRRRNRGRQNRVTVAIPKPTNPVELFGSPKLSVLLAARMLAQVTEKVIME